MNDAPVNDFKPLFTKERVNELAGADTQRGPVDAACSGGRSAVIIGPVICGGKGVVRPGR